MSRAQWNKVRDEWRANRRLRLVSLVVLMIAGLHGASSLQQLADADRQRFESDLELQARLEGLRAQDAWAQRAEDAEAALDAMRERVPEVANTGLAQAELQAWLAELAAANGLQEPRIQIQDTLDVPTHPDMWQVLARLEGQVPQYGQGGLLRALSEALPWIQVERLEVGGDSPRVNMVVRAYYRRLPAADVPVDVTAPSAGQVSATPTEETLP